DATPYLDPDSVSPRSIKIGEAALALDPLSSSGVQKAINTALSGAVVINTLLRRPEQAEAASRLHTANHAEASDLHVRWVARHGDSGPEPPSEVMPNARRGSRCGTGSN